MQRTSRPHTPRPRCSAPLVAGLLVVAAACGATPEAPLTETGDAAGGAGASAATNAPVNGIGRARCRAPAGVSASPQTTAEAIELLNALPKPTGVPCFLESLDRPLLAYATSSVFSAQPALSAVSPRVFLKLGRLWLSVVLDGKSSYLMEFGERLPAEPLRSIKGELELPLAQLVPASAPYDRVRYAEGTVCGLCHYDESAMADPSLIGTFSSIAFRPRSETRVAIDHLRDASTTCDWRTQPHRCEMLSALFDGGAVVEESFPETMPTFY